jgi:hypothetical protein
MSMEIDAHTVVPDADAAATWYARAFGAEEESRIPLPGGKVLSVVLRFGRSHVHVASEFPDFGVVSPLTIGGTAIPTTQTPYGRARSQRERKSITTSPISSGVSATGNSPIRSAIVGTSRNIYETSRPLRSRLLRRACSPRSQLRDR